jgi:microcystin-dependent protein
MYQLRSEKAQASGYASLDATGKVPAAQLPAAPQSVPSGAGHDWYAAAAPSGYLLCDGSAVSRTTFAALFAVVGTTWGAGDGSTTFNLPDTRGRVLVGMASGGHADVATLAGDDGTALASRRPRHPHTIPALGAGHNLTLPDHWHNVYDPGHLHYVHAYQYTTTGNYMQIASGNTSAGYEANRGWVDAAGTGIQVQSPQQWPAINGGVQLNGYVGPGGGTTDAPSYVVANKIIKT